MNDFVIADPGKCIGCRTCEVACVMAHQKEQALEKLTVENFSPRLRVVKTAKVTMPIQCHQCEDAPCAKACAAQAIVQQDQSVQVIQGRCIGCKACLMACPYGAMDLVLTAAPAQGESKVEALKCDLCRKQDGGPSCIKVCPTKALYEVRGSKMVEQMQNRRKRAALGVTSSR
ncbi:4Fe-4S dicluster domain-containing protein [Pelosinus baikalensis]|uniref:4Fe-4S dicluster domain-containing protein n=1 Tax=Pelosinus baikalensis TaxID=2892015 RepID=A0ABS8HVP6_9FIRM|nr:4Fe-4S dicluster domain-containing protein [Pelosinus baikalensis]MCC5466343.1 4Fe-4S dicluster domain-containing protein [Pelosinus baikalensis]